jgi:hypothetical protein
MKVNGTWVDTRKKKIMPSSRTITKHISVDKVKFTLEIYPAREGCSGTEGPFWEIFPEDYHAALFAFSNKDKLNKLIEQKFL